MGIQMIQTTFEDGEQDINEFIQCLNQMAEMMEAGKLEDLEETARAKIQELGEGATRLGVSITKLFAQKA